MVGRKGIAIMTGTLYGVGVGPGDPELLTLKALRLIRRAPVIAWPAPETGESFARSIVVEHLRADQVEIPIRVPMRADRFPAREVYDQAATKISGHLVAGRDVVALCEGDPFFYGSFMYLFERIASRFPVEIVPGVSSLTAAAAALCRPLAGRNDVLTVIPAPLENDRIRQLLASSEAVAIIKVGRHFVRIQALLAEAGLLEQAMLAERIGRANQRLLRLSDPGIGEAPYFSVILVYKGAEAWICELPLAAGAPA